MASRIPPELARLGLSRTPLPREDEEVALMGAFGIAEDDARLLFRLDDALQRMPPDERRATLEALRRFDPRSDGLPHRESDGTGFPHATR